MYKNRHFQLLLCACTIVLAMYFGVYVSGFAFAAWLLISIASYLFYRSQLLSKKPADILLKMMRSQSWLILSLSYTATILHIFGNTIANFMPGLLIAIGGFWLICWDDLESEPQPIVGHIISLLLIWLSLSWVSLTLATYRWPVIVMLPIVWIGQFLIALWWAASAGERAEFVAAVWAIIMVEFVWVSSRWLTLYQVSRFGLVLSQVAILGMAAGYSLGGLYYHREHKKLTRALVFEYFSISAIVFILVIMMTKWSNAL